ncbi:hypothetical protein FRX31_024136, partial [Thalictrum thalictroides]
KLPRRVDVPYDSSNPEHQIKCFIVPLPPSELVDIKHDVQEKHPEEKFVSALSLDLVVLEKAVVLITSWWVVMTGFLEFPHDEEQLV